MGCDIVDSYGIRGYEMCSGNGHCINSKCVCNEDWSSLGDFHLEDGIECDIKLSVIKYWTLCNLILSSLAVIAAIFCLSYDYCHLRNIGKKFFTRDGKQMFSFYLGLAALIIALYSACKFADPRNANIGSRDHLHVIIFAVAIVYITMLSGSAFTLILIKFLRGHLIFMNSTNKERLVVIMNVVSSAAFIFPACIMICLLLSVLICTYQPPSQSYIYYLVYEATYNVAFLAYGMPVVFISHTFLTDLKRSMVISSASSVMSSSMGFQAKETSETIASIRKQFQLIHMILTPAIFSCIPINALFLLWYFLNRKFVYLFCFQNTIVSSFGLIFVIAIHRTISTNRVTSSSKSSIIEVKHLASMKSNGRKTASVPMIVHDSAQTLQYKA
jgi:hypothetical protein